MAKGIRTLQEGGKIFALIPLEEYERLLEKTEQLSDEALYDLARVRNEEAFPMALYDAIDKGEHPVRAFREYRGMNQKTLADTAGLSEAFVCQIESGKRKGSVESLKSIAKALRVNLDDLII